MKIYWKLLKSNTPIKTWNCSEEKESHGNTVLMITWKLKKKLSPNLLFFCQKWV